jgi:1-acyl-sn-glycerol-3-phosphate acyltransferase
MARGEQAGLADVARSLAFYVAFYGGSLVLVIWALIQLVFSPGMVRDTARRWSEYHRACLRRLVGIHIAVTGDLPVGPTLIACKHESFFEAIDTLAMFHEPAVFAKAELMRIPLWGRVAQAQGLIPVSRDQGARALRAMVGAARRASNEGRPLVIFPEGTRVPHGSGARLQAGFAGLYKLLDLPVVPVAVASGALYHRTWKRPGTIAIRIGETIPAGLPREEIEMRVQTAINALNPQAPA